MNKYKSLKKTENTVPDPTNSLQQFDPFVHEKESFRPAKIANRIKEELLLLVPDSIRDPKFDKLRAIAITEVICTPDLRNARVNFSMYENEEKYKDVEKILNNAAGFLRREVSDRLGIKYTPMFNFHYDKGMAHSKKIHDLLKSKPAGYDGVASDGTTESNVADHPTSPDDDSNESSEP